MLHIEYMINHNKFRVFLIGFIGFVISIIIGSVLLIVLNKKEEYRIIDCPVSITGLEMDTVCISPEVYDSIMKENNEIRYVIYPTNLHSFYSREIQNFLFNGDSIQILEARCYEERISYDEYCARCSVYNEAKKEETKFLKDLFYKDTSVIIKDQLENGFFSTDLSLQQLISLLNMDKIPPLFICTEREYYQNYNAPIAIPN